ncbi:hypothetical protein PQR02_38730 [Paraburkholderia sediminicola]|uniref:Uncharacterized protein n=1 Tax=Paraburkholderia rhynchosiae TaxID=487049 RepID=A0ACC7NSP9_9BURK
MILPQCWREVVHSEPTTGDGARGITARRNIASAVAAAVTMCPHWFRDLQVLLVVSTANARYVEFFRRSGAEFKGGTAHGARDGLDHSPGPNQNGLWIRVRANSSGTEFGQSLSLVHPTKPSFKRLVHSETRGMPMEGFRPKLSFVHLHVNVG